MKTINPKTKLQYEINNMMHLKKYIKEHMIMFIFNIIKNINSCQNSLKNIQVDKQISTELNNLRYQRDKYQQKVLVDINNIIHSLINAQNELSMFNIDNNLRNGYSIILDDHNQIVTSKKVLEKLSSFTILLSDGQFIYQKN